MAIFTRQTGLAVACVLVSLSGLRQAGEVDRTRVLLVAVWSGSYREQAEGLAKYCETNLTGCRFDAVVISAAERATAGAAKRALEQARTHGDPFGQVWVWDLSADTADAELPDWQAIAEWYQVQQAAKGGTPPLVLDGRIWAHTREIHKITERPHITAYLRNLASYMDQFGGGLAILTDHDDSSAGKGNFQTGANELLALLGLPGFSGRKEAENLHAAVGMESHPLLEGIALRGLGTYSTGVAPTDPDANVVPLVLYPDGDVAIAVRPGWCLSALASESEVVVRFVGTPVGAHVRLVVGRATPSGAEVTQVGPAGAYRLRVAHPILDLGIRSAGEDRAVTWAFRGPTLALEGGTAPQCLVSSGNAPRLLPALTDAFVEDLRFQVFVEVGSQITPGPVVGPRRNQRD